MHAKVGFEILDMTLAAPVATPDTRAAVTVEPPAGPEGRRPATPTRVGTPMPLDRQWAAIRDGLDAAAAKAAAARAAAAASAAGDPRAA